MTEVSLSWSADDVLNGKVDDVSDEEATRLYHEAMDDPETVTLVIKGRNGKTVQIRINSHERTRLVFEQSYDQEKPPDEWLHYHWPYEMWAPRWKRFTWTIEQRFDYRVDDFLAARRSR